jgi:hypothetical protein
MGLDLYAGTVTRYLTGNWQTIAQREFGARIIYADGEAPWIIHNEAVATVSAWKEYLRSAFKEFADLSWNESEEAPYDSDKPDHEGRQALVLWTAYIHRPDLQRPKSRIVDSESDPAYEQAVDQKYYFGPMAVLESQVFIPSPVPFWTFGKNWNGDDCAIATTAQLRAALDFVNSNSWRAQRDDFKQWRLDGLPTDAVYEEVERRSFWPWRKNPVKKYIKKDLPPPGDWFQQAAQHGYAIYFSLLEFSEQHGVPILVDE